jgi:hypothetical protein
MPNYFYNSPWEDAANVGQNIGDNLSKILMEIPMMRQRMALQQAQLGQEQQRIGLEEQRVGMEGKRLAIETPHIQAQTALANQDIEAAKQSQAMRELVSKLGLGQGQLLNPATANNQESLQSLVGLLRGAGAAPQGEFTGTRQDLANLVDSAIRSTLASQAAMSPAASANLLGAVNVPEGSQLVQRLPLAMGAQPPEVRNKEFPPQRAPQQKNNDAVIYSGALRLVQGISKLPPLEQKKAMQTPEYQQATNIVRQFNDTFMKSQANAPAKPPMTATNPQTGQRIISHDGGQSWSPL